MNKRRLGKTGLLVSEIGFGGEWLERHEAAESIALIKYAQEQGINIIDCWMADPKSRDIIGKAIEGSRDKWIIQGHIGSTWQKGQYVRSRDIKYVKPAFEDLLARLKTDYIDLGMIHYVDSEEDWKTCTSSEYFEYIKELHSQGIIRHIGISTHNPVIAKLAILSGFVEMIMFSINPAFDMKPPTDDLISIFGCYDDQNMKGIAPERMEVYRLAEENDIAMTVMKGYFGGKLFDEKTSPFGAAFTPVQCIHYSLTRPSVSSILCGYDTTAQIDAALAYETASPDEKDFATVIANAPYHSYKGQCTYCGHCKPCPSDIDIAMVNKFYDLATQQPSVPDSIRSHYSLIPHAASECIACHACESRCPFEVKIADRMKKAAALFGR